MAEPEYYNEIKAYVEYIKSTIKSTLQHKKLEKRFKDAVHAVKEGKEEALFEFLDELETEYPDELKFSEFSATLANSNSEEKPEVKASVEPAEEAGEPALPEVTAAPPEVTRVPEVTAAPPEVTRVPEVTAAPPETTSTTTSTSNTSSSEEEEFEHFNFNAEDEDEEEEEDEEEDEDEDEVTPDEKEGIPMPAVVPEATAESAAALEEIQIGESIRGLPVVPKATLAQGDCFFSSIYRSAGEGGLLQKLEECLGVAIDTEDKFIIDMRKKVAEKILSGELPTEGGQDLYEDILIPRSFDEVLWPEVLKAYPRWFVAAFKELPGNKEEFYTKYSQLVNQRRRDVSQYEVAIVENMVKECGVRINKQNREIARGIPGVLNIFNQGEYHWVYFSFDVPDKYETSIEFLQKELEDCNEKCRSITARLKSEKKHWTEYAKWKKNPKLAPNFEKRKGKIYNGVLHKGGTPPVNRKKTRKQKKRVTRKSKSGVAMRKRVSRSKN